MLSSAHFYYQLTRKYVVIFGTMFNDILLVRRDPTTKQELERVKVPILYGPKEKYIYHLQQDPDLQKEIAITLPRMSYEITGIQYDPSRKQNTMLRQAKGNTATRVASNYMGVPYNFTIEMSIYSRNIDDANQVLEQILPYFTPDYTITVNPIPELGFTKDIPIVLDTVSQEITYEGNYESTRMIIHNLTFTLKGYFWGPVTNPKIIRKVIANIFNDPSLQAGYVTRVNVTGTGDFKRDDLVYQGPNYQTATAYGTVLSWFPGNGKLMLGGVQGQFKVNNTIRALSTNATYTIESFDVSPLKLASIVTEPDPLTAEPTDDFGYTQTITEFPDTV